MIEFHVLQITFGILYSFSLAKIQSFSESAKLSYIEDAQRQRIKFPASVLSMD